MPDREAIIEAMAEAAALNDPVWPGETVDDLSRDDRARYRTMTEAAYDASPIERYRKALVECAIVLEALHAARGTGITLEIGNAVGIARTALGIGFLEGKVTRALRGDD